MSQQQKIDLCQATLREYLHNLVGLGYIKDGRGLLGVDCYGLVIKVYSECFDISIPKLTGSYSGNVSKQDLCSIAESKAAIWEKTESPVIGDVLLFRDGSRRHVGIWLEHNRMLHTTEQTNACIEKYENFHWKNRIIGIYRHKRNWQNVTN